jgi:hypothetical protein
MNYIINHIMRLKQRHHITKIYVDGANPEVIRELKSRIGEYHDYYGRLTEEQIWSLQQLIVSLRTAFVTDEWKLDKQQTSNNDIVDSFML